MKNQLASNSQFDYMYTFKDLALERETKMFQLSTCIRFKSKIPRQLLGLVLNNIDYLEIMSRLLGLVKALEQGLMSYNHHLYDSHKEF